MEPLSTKLPWELAAPKWARAINPLLANSIMSGTAILGITLANGSNTINHGLGREMLGWFPIDVNGPATIYRSQPMNAKTLTLISNAACQVNLWVF